MEETERGQAFLLPLRLLAPGIMSCPQLEWSELGGETRRLALDTLSLKSQLNAKWR